MGFMLVAIGLLIVDCVASAEVRAEPSVQLAQQGKFKRSGSWIWTFESRKGVDPNNRSSVEVLKDRHAIFCMNKYCTQITYTENNGLFSFTYGDWVKSYIEMWSGDNGSLEGRLWKDQSKRHSTPPDAMIRMMP